MLHIKGNFYGIIHIFISSFPEFLSLPLPLLLFKRKVSANRELCQNPSTSVLEVTERVLPLLQGHLMVDRAGSTYSGWWGSDELKHTFISKDTNSLGIIRHPEQQGKSH